MKTGILTFHWANNYGAVLQVYALQKIVEQMGVDVQIIDFRAHKSKSMLLQKAISQLIRIPSYMEKKERNDRFTSFRRERLKLTDNNYSTEEQLIDCLPLFDTFICGSDQIWNPSIKGFSKAYLLSFVPAEKRKISYAASFGLNHIPDAHLDTFKKYLKRLHHISVREQDGIALVKELTGKQATHVLDPVFLLNAEEWEKTAKTPTDKEEYVLLFIMEKSQVLINLATRLAKETGKKLVSINIRKNKVQEADVNISNAGPQEFLGLIKNASYVCTNSFHATAFSILFNKPFMTVPHTTRNSRMESLLNILGIASQMMSKTLDCEELQGKFHYDTNPVHERLQNEKKKSLDFLTQALSGNQGKNEPTE